MIGLSYAGIPLNVPTDEVTAWAYGNLSPADLFESTRKSWCQGFSLDPDSLGFFSKERVELNRLVWPSSCSRWAYGFFIASKARAEAVIELALPNGRLVAQPLVMRTRVDDGSPAAHVYSDHGSIVAQMYCLPPRPLSGLDDLYLLPLVDVRYLLWARNTGQIVFDDDRDRREENGTSYAYEAADDAMEIERSNGAAQTDSFPDPSGLADGWSVLINNTGGQLTLSLAPYALDGQSSVIVPAGKKLLVFSDGETYYTGWPWVYRLMAVAADVAIAHDAIDIDYLHPSAVVRNHYDPFPPWLDTLAWNVGQRIVVGLDGSISAQNPPPSVSPDAIDLGGHKIAGGKVIGLWNSQGQAVARCPAAGLSVHPDFEGHTFLGTYTGGAGTISPASLAGNQGTAVLKSPVKSSESISGLASRWVSDLCLWQAGAYDVQYAGIQPLAPSGLHGTIIWTYRADECSTRIQYSDYPALAWEPTGYEEPVEADDSSWCATFSVAPALKACFGDDDGEPWCATFSVAPAMKACFVLDLLNNRLAGSSGGQIVERGAMTDGQLPIGSTGAAPVNATLTAGSGITITNGAGSITIASDAASGGSSILSDNARMCINTRSSPVEIHTAGFTADRWLVETENSVVYYEYQTDPFAGSCCAARFTKLTNTGKFLVAQWLKSCPYKFFNGRAVHSRMSLRASKSLDIRFGFLLWDGTADAVTTPHVSAWNGDGSDPTFETDLTGSVSTFAATTSWGGFAASNPGMSFENLAFAFWTDDQLEAGDWIEITDAFLGSGSAEDGNFPDYPATYPPRPELDELACTYHGSLGGIFN